MSFRRSFYALVYFYAVFHKKSQQIIRFSSFSFFASEGWNSVLGLFFRRELGENILKTAQNLPVQEITDPILAVVRLLTKA